MSVSNVALPDRVTQNPNWTPLRPEPGTDRGTTVWKVGIHQSQTCLHSWKDAGGNTS